MSTQQLKEIGEPEVNGKIQDWIRTTSYKILAIGAGLREFLRFTEKIIFSEEPSNTPDPEFISELVDLITREQHAAEDD